MPFGKPVLKLLFLILILLFIGIGKNNVRGNELPDANATRQIRLKDDSLAIKKIRKLVQMQIDSADKIKFTVKDYLDRAYELANKTKNLGFLSDQMNYIGNRERYAGHYSIALSFYKEGLKITKQLNDSSLMAHLYDNIAVTYRKIDDYQNSLKYSVQAIHLNTLLKDSLGLAISLNNLGNTQIQLGEYNDALNSFKQSMELERNRNNKIGLAINLNNIGNVYNVQKQYKQAISYYNLSLEINRQINSQKGIAICYNDLSSVYHDMGKYKKSMEHSRKALAISKKIGFSRGEATAYLDMGVNYSKMNQHEKAIENIRKGINLIKPLEVKAFLEYAYRTLYEIYFKTKDYEKALKYIRLAQNYHDTLLNINVQNNIERLQIEYKTKQKENQIVLLDQKARLAAVNMKKQSYLIYLFMSAFLLTLIILSLTVIFLRRRRKTNRILTEKNKEIEEARNALKKNEKELIKAKEEAEKNALAKSQIMADLSHEIRTPLNSVIGFSDLLYESLEDEKQKKYLEAISASGKGLLSLINEILESTKYNKNKVPLELADLDLRESVLEITNIFALKAEEKNISLETHFPKKLPQIIYFNKMVLQQILLNLVGNAIKFTEQGHVKIMVYNKKGTVKGSIHLFIEIEDTGIGIPREEQKKIFKPFHQVHHNSNQEGNGLGLSITKNLAKKMNGSIRLVSKKGRGSRFILSFRNVKALQEAPPTDLVSSLMSHIQKPPFLFVNQNASITKTVKDVFRELDFSLLDVGINLKKAREHFPNCHLTVLCCLGQEELVNTLTILENENLKSDHQFLIITKNHDFAPKGTDRTILSVPENQEELPEKLRKFLKSYQEELLEHVLFSPIMANEQNQEIKTSFKKIFENEFEAACSTRMLDNISQLADILKNEGEKYQLTNLITFAATLTQNISHFDTPAIDKQLGILEKSFYKTFNFKWE